MLANTALGWRLDELNDGQNQFKQSPNIKQKSRLGRAYQINTKSIWRSVSHNYFSSLTRTCEYSGSVLLQVLVQLPSVLWD